MGYDYVVVGHVTVDRLDGRPPRAGGTALYAGVQAARLGLRTLVVTRGAGDQLDRLLAPYQAEIDVWVQEAPATTTFVTAGAGDDRVQRITRWAGPVEPVEVPDAGVLHLAPVAAEVSATWPRAGARLLGVTPQGTMRRWRDGGVVSLATLGEEDLPGDADAVVVSALERAGARDRLARAAAAGAVCIVTQGGSSAEILEGDGAREVALGAVSATDDVGAGDVFAAALFAALADGRGTADAVRFAHVAAALRVAGEGPEAICDRATIEDGLAASPATP